MNLADKTVILRAGRPDPQVRRAQRRISLQWGAHTNRGPRPENQDSYSLPNQAEQDKCQFGVLLVVCDGVGGAVGGSEAAQVAASASQSAFYSSDGPASPRERLEWAIGQANEEILRIAERRHQPQMATTIVAACVQDDRLYIAYAGDSRAYIFRGGRLRLLTSDHSAVIEDANRGLIAMSDVDRVNYRNIITRSLGPAANGQLEHRLESLRPGDRVLLCTDGLYTALSEEQIERVLNRPVSAQQAAELLVARAVRSPDIKDNVTAAVLDYGVPVIALPFAGKPLLWLSRIVGGIALIVLGVALWSLITATNSPELLPRPSLTSAANPLPGSKLMPAGLDGEQAPASPISSATDKAASGSSPRATTTLAALVSTPTRNPATPTAARTPTLPASPSPQTSSPTSPSAAQPPRPVQPPSPLPPTPTLEPPTPTSPPIPTTAVPAFDTPTPIPVHTDTPEPTAPPTNTDTPVPPDTPTPPDTSTPMP